MIGIYKITSPTSKVYIGQSTDIEKRWGKYRNVNCKRQPKLYNSFKKHGVENHIFEVLCQCSIDELNEMERFYQDAFCALNDKGLNCVLTTSSDRYGVHSISTREKMSKAKKGKPLSEETRLKISTALKNMSDEKRDSINKRRKKVSDITRKKMSESQIGRTATKETRAKLRASRLGKVASIETRYKISMAVKNISNETKLKLSIARKGRIISIETRNKISNSNKGKVLSKETRNKLSLANIGKTKSAESIEKTASASRKIVLHLETGVFFDGCKIAAKSLNFNPNTFKSMLNGNHKVNKTNCIYI